MRVQLINEDLLSDLYEKASASERLRQAFDLRTTSEDGSQRMLNALQPGTRVPIHRHIKTSETNICLEGCLDVIFYEELPNMDARGKVHDGERAFDETCFREESRLRLCPTENKYGVQIPAMAWHSIEVYEPSTIFEAKDGAYMLPTRG